jgi:hypothetical protein
LERFGEKLYRYKSTRKQDRKEVKNNPKYPHLLKPKTSETESKLAYKPEHTYQETEGYSKSKGRQVK